MPKNTKDNNIINSKSIEKNENNIKNKKKSDTSKTDKVASSSSNPKTTTKKSTTTSNSKVNKSTSTTKATVDKTTIVKKSSTKKATTTKKTSTKSTTTRKKSTSKVEKTNSNIILEYYDLPYRYNETIVKVLYQTPTILFVYWDISDNDRNNFITKYGDNFFYNTKPILKIYNITMDYSFEVEVDDFANSWYIAVNDANCEYKVELGRKTIKYEKNINSDYIYVSSSNSIEFPNDHILIEQLPNNVIFKNTKNNNTYTKDISLIHLVKFNKFYNVNDFYKTFYKDELEESFSFKNLTNSSLSSWN